MFAPPPVIETTVSESERVRSRNHDARDCIALLAGR